MIEEIKKFLIEIVKLDDIEITEDICIKRDLKLDSLDLINLIIQIEDNYNINLFEKIDKEKIDNMKLIDICKIIEEEVKVC